MANIRSDPEKDVMSSTARSMLPSWASTAPGDTKLDGPPKPTRLQLFQVLVGIHTPPSLTQDGIDVVRATDTDNCRARIDNIGLYQRAKERERTARIAYLCTSYVSNILYILQILLAATFTSLSAYKDAKPVVLTVLGALNTVLAGCLAWTKGQGVPQRYRKAQDQYQALILEIDMTERAFFEFEASCGQDGADLDPQAEKARLQKLYDEARADQQANYPDLYVSTGATTAKATKDLTKQLDDAQADAMKVQSELMAKIETLMSKLESKAGTQIESAIQSVGSGSRYQGRLGDNAS